MCSVEFVKLNTRVAFHTEDNERMYRELRCPSVVRKLGPFYQFTIVLGFYCSGAWRKLPHLVFLGNCRIIRPLPNQSFGVYTKDGGPQAF